MGMPKDHIRYFSHHHDQIPGKKQCNGGLFDSWFQDVAHYDRQGMAPAIQGCLHLQDLETEAEIAMLN